MTVDIYSKTSQDGLTLAELDLYHQIIKYRASLGLAPIPLSSSLTTTGGRHALDLRENIWAAGKTLPPGTNLHSWSDHYYYEDHRDPWAMWGAPLRLGTGYASAGYEIIAAGYASSADALEGWKNSPGHNAVMTQSGAWSDVKFAAIGIGVETAPGAGPYGGRVYDAWFGELVDPAGAPTIRGTGLADTFTGTAFSDRLYGLGGADRIDAGGGNDVVDGGNGKDLLLGAKGHDTLRGGGGKDVLKGGSGNDTLFGGIGNDRLHGDVGNDRLFGEAGDDGMRGGPGIDDLAGGDGNDGMHGDEDADLLHGNAGDDLLYGDDGDDRLFGDAGDDLLSGGRGNDHLSGGTGSDVLHGGKGNDSLSAGSGSDRLYGNSGADRLVAGPGHDILSGGPGADTFVFASPDLAGLGVGRDGITDFQTGSDHIDLSRMDADSGTPGNQAFHFVSGAPDGPGSLTSQPGVVAGDIDGDGTFDFEIAVAGGIPGPGDFLL